MCPAHTYSIPDIYRSMFATTVHQDYSWIKTRLLARYPSLSTMEIDILYCQSIQSNIMALMHGYSVASLITDENNDCVLYDGDMSPSREEKTP